MTTYADLVTAVIEDTHRPDLASLVPRFIREGEGMIRRELIAHLLTRTLSDTDRTAPDSSIYNLPAGTLIIRRIALQDQHRRELTRIALGALTLHPFTQRVSVYAEAGDGTIEIRGGVETGIVFDLNYYGMPDELVNDTDTNDLLDSNETLYKSGAMFNLYQHTQDRELAQDALSIFSDVIETLNEQISRKVGGANVTASYNFSGGSSY